MQQNCKKNNRCGGGGICVISGIQQYHVGARLCLLVSGLKNANTNNSRTDVPIWHNCKIRHDGQTEDLNHSMVIEASSLSRAFCCCCCSSSDTSGELSPTPLSTLVSCVRAAVSSASILREAGVSKESRGSGDRKPDELSKFWVEDDTWEMTDIWTEEEVEVAVVVDVLPGYAGWCWDSTSSYWTPRASSSSCTWLR